MFIFILTRWHDDDLAGRVLKASKEAKEAGEAYDEWDVVEFKAIATEDDEHRKEGQALWPEKFSIEKLRKKKTDMGSYEFSALYQQTPIDEENRKFKDEWYKYRDYSEVQKLDTYNVLTIDPRGKDDIKLGKDYIGTTINFIDLQNNWNVITKRMKLSASGLVDFMFDAWVKYKLHKICIEDNQFTQGLKHSWEEQSLVRGIFPLIELVKTGGRQKELRIEALVPRYERGAIYHIKINNENTCEALEEELRLFPKSPNDDASDSLAYQLDAALRPTDEEDDSTSGNITALWGS